MRSNLKSPRAKRGFKPIEYTNTLSGFSQQVKWGPQQRDVLSLAVARNAVVTVCEVQDESRLNSIWSVCAIDTDKGGTFWEEPLPSEPLVNGLLIDRFGRVIVMLKNGGVVCHGSKS